MQLSKLGELLLDLKLKNINILIHHLLLDINYNVKLFVTHVLVKRIGIFRI